jgi:hypothetical protein
MMQVHGDALALCTHPGTAFTTADWERLDNAIYEQLADPSADVQAVAADCRAGESGGRGRGKEGRQQCRIAAGSDSAAASAEPRVQRAGLVCMGSAGIGWH